MSTTKYVYYIYPDGYPDKGHVFVSRKPISHLLEVSKYTLYISCLIKAYQNRHIDFSMPVSGGTIQLPPELRLNLLETATSRVRVSFITKAEQSEAYGAYRRAIVTLRGFSWKVSNPCRPSTFYLPFDIAPDRVISNAKLVDNCITDFSETGLITCIL